ncbi:MAG: hypothetical protein Q4D62_15725 [Planctomycetia bacterium]|nr:hypothetical protein [Planctomycetia bacterium]
MLRRTSDIAESNFSPKIGRFLLAALILLGAGTGCQSVRALFRGNNTSPPVSQAVLGEQATLLEIITVVNANVQKIDSFATTNATLGGDGFFTLKGEIAFKRPGLFRLRGSHAVSGAEIDIGRNQEVSWMWVGKAEPKATYYVRNDQYASCQFAQELPIDPTWMIDAMGFGILDPHLPYEGPFPVDEAHVELRVKEKTASGNMRTRVILINRVRGLPAAQQIYDKYDTLAVDSRVKSYHTEDSGITLPQTIEIRCPKENDGKGMTIHINFGTPTLNHLDANNTHLWAMPQFPGYPPKNMANL